MKKLLYKIISLSLLFATVSFAANDYTNLHNFSGGNGDGRTPRGSLILINGVFYGMTYQGGVNDIGVIFKMDKKNNNYVNLHEFTGGNGDGRLPYYGALTLLGSTLYGMTSEGGTNNYGVIFKIATNGNNYATIHEFANDNDGWEPYGSLLISDNKLYGMSHNGGKGDGEIFKVDIDGKNYSTLHKFGDFSHDGLWPYGSLILFNNKLYGMTNEGGTNNAGTIFRIDLNGANYTNLHNFARTSGNGACPYGSLVYYDGVFYGMTKSGGADSFGVVFKINTDGSGYANLHEFNGNDGRYPYGNPMIYDYKIYGLIEDGLSSHGAIFQMDIDGNNYTNLHNFHSNIYDGGNPYGSLTLFDDALYGMTSFGGSSAKGVIFKQLLSEVPEPFCLSFVIINLILLFKKIKSKN